MKKIKIKDPMWLKEIYLLIGDTEECNTFLRKKHDANFIGFNGEGGFANSPDDVGYIWIKEYDESIQSLGILLHEVNHLVFEELKRRGFYLNEGSEEAYCYYAQRIFQTILGKLLIEYENKKRNRRSKLGSNK